MAKYELEQWAPEYLPRKNHLLNESRAVPIFKNIGRKMSLDEDALGKILLHKQLENVPISVIAIAGAFRKGKSFMLNFFLRYLQKKGYNNMNWLDDKDQSLHGFDWAGGVDACTSGILMWNDVLFVEKEGKKVAVILMDTQGLFDNKTDTKTNTLIFAMSNLISSVQVFNLSQQIQENDLEFLQYLTEYSKAYSDMKAQFQSLVFLVRDWQNPDDFNFGFDGGENYLNKILRQRSTSREVESVRQHIRSGFEEIKCCLMPHPGNKVACTRKERIFTGNLRDIDEEFLEELEKFVNRLLHPDNLKIKSCFGETLFGSKLYSQIIAHSKFLDDASSPDSFTLMEVHAQNMYLTAENQCVARYKTAMNKNDQWFEAHELERMHISQQAKACKIFEENTKFGPREIQLRYRDNMRRRIDEEYNNLKRTNTLGKSLYEESLKNTVMELVERYRENMNEETEGGNSKTYCDLETSHNKVLKQKRLDFERKEFQDSATKHASERELEEKILTEFGKFKQRNNKLREAEELRKKRETLKSFSDMSIADYKSNMVCSEYMEERTLKRRHDLKKSSALDSFHRKSVGIQASEDILHEQKSNCIEEIEMAYPQFRRRNNNLSISLKSNLSAKREEIVEQFDEHFRRIRPSHCPEPFLKSMHEKEERKFCAEEESRCGDKIDIDVYREHLSDLRKLLGDRYARTRSEYDYCTRIECIIC